MVALLHSMHHMHAFVIEHVAMHPFNTEIFVGTYVPILKFPADNVVQETVTILLPPSGNIVRNPPTTMYENIVRNCQADALYELKYVSIMCCLQLKSVK